MSFFVCFLPVSCPFFYQNDLDDDDSDNDNDSCDSGDDTDSDSNGDDNSILFSDSECEAFFLKRQ